MNREELISAGLIENHEFPNEDLAGKTCAACGKPSEGYRSIHRDWFGEGPEVPLCNDCGLHEYPSCPELWNRIRFLDLYDDYGNLNDHQQYSYDFEIMDIKKATMNTVTTDDNTDDNEEKKQMIRLHPVKPVKQLTTIGGIISWIPGATSSNIIYYPIGTWGNIGEPVVDDKKAEEPAEIRYGATCTKCNEIYEHAEWRENFICYPCRVEF